MPRISGSSDEISKMPIAVGRQVADELVDLHLGGHIHPARRLIQDQHSRLRQQPLGQHHLLLVPAAELTGQPVEQRRADIQFVHLLLHLRCLRASVDAHPTGSAWSYDARLTLSRIEQFITSPSRLRSSVSEGNPLPNRLARGVGVDRLALQMDLARARSGSAPKMQRATWVRPLPTSPNMPRISPRCSEKETSEKEPARLRPLTSRATSSRAGLARGKDLAQRPSDHHPDQLVLVGLLRLHRADQLAVLEHGDPIGDLEHLIQPVGDVQDQRPCSRLSCGPARTGGSVPPAKARPMAHPGSGSAARTATALAISTICWWETLSCRTRVRTSIPMKPIDRQDLLCPAVGLRPIHAARQRGTRASGPAGCSRRWSGGGTRLNSWYTARMPSGGRRGGC